MQKIHPLSCLIGGIFIFINPNYLFDFHICEVLEALVEMKREEKKLEMRDYRHKSLLMFEKFEFGERFGHYSISAADEYFAKVKTENLIKGIKNLKPLLRRRFCMYHIYSMTMDNIAESENVSRTAVIKSVRRAEAILREVLGE